MTEEANVEHRGFWWSPDKPECRYPGVLTYSPEKGAHLDLFADGDWMVFTPDQVFETLFGQTDHKAEVTVCNPRSISWGFSSSGIHKLGLSSSLVLLGAHVASAHEKCATHISSRYSNLEGWLAESGVAVKRSARRHAFSVHAKRTSSDIYHLGNGLGIQFSRWTSTQPDPWSAEVKFLQPAQVEFIFKNPTGLLEGLDHVAHMEALIALATRNPCVASNIVCLLVGYDHGHHPRVVNVLSRRRGTGLVVADLMPHDFFFRQTEFGIDTREFLENWYSKRELLSFPLALYHSAAHRSESLESSFVATMQCLEALLRRTQSAEFMPHQEFSRVVLPQILASIPAELDPHFKEALLSRLRYSNEWSLARRIRVALDALGPVIEELMRPFGGPAKLSRIIVDTRNYLTHFSPVPEHSRPTVHEIYFSREVSRLLVELCFCRELGFTSELLRSLVGNSGVYQQLCRHSLLTIQAIRGRISN